MTKELFEKHRYNPKCYGVAKNYFTEAIKVHGAENVKKPEFPFMYSKPFSCLKPKNKNYQIAFYAGDKEIVHEVGLGVILKKGGKNIDRKDWMDYIGGYFLVLEYCDRTTLEKLAEKKLPWN